MISLIITGYRRGGVDHATPLIAEVRKFEPDIEIILADCNSTPPYEPSPDYKLLKIPKPFNLPRMYNTSIREAKGDWLMIANDDVTCFGPFSNKIQSIEDKGNLYTNRKGRKIIDPHHVRVWVVHGWLMILHRELYERMGEFDESYAMTGVDLEYSIRAKDMGIEIVPLYLPLKHVRNHRSG